MAARDPLAGPLDAVCAWTMKHPPREMSDPDARKAFIQKCGTPDSGTGFQPLLAGTCVK